MKKMLLFFTAIALISAVAFAAGRQEGSGPCGIWLCTDHPELNSRPHCDALPSGSPMITTHKCCYKNAPALNPATDCPEWWERHNNGRRGDNGTKTGVNTINNSKPRGKKITTTPRPALPAKPTTNLKPKTQIAKTSVVKPSTKVTSAKKTEKTK